MEQQVTERNTKAQILAAYNKLLKKIKEKSDDNPKEVQQRRQDAQTVKAAQQSSGTSISDQIAKVKLEFISSLESIEKELIGERQKLETIQNAIGIEEKKLEDLYGLSAGTDSLAAILLAQKEQKEQFETVMELRKEELTAQIAKTREQWEKEKALHEEVTKAEKEINAKLRKREEEEYNYTIRQKRRQEQDDYDQKKSRQEAELKEQKLNFEKEFSEREKQLKESEEELSTLREESAGFQAKLEAAVQTAQKETENHLKTIYNYEKELREKEMQGIVNLKDHQVKSLEAKIKEMETQLKEAGIKVDISEKTVKDIALKAIETSSKPQIIERERLKE